MRCEIPRIFSRIIQARTSCYLVTHGCLSILTRTQREGQEKKSEREMTMGKQNQIFLPAVLFISTRCFLTPHICGFEMEVARAIFLPLYPWKNTLKHTQKKSKFIPTPASLEVNSVISLFPYAKIAFFPFWPLPHPCPGKGPVICEAECDKDLLWNMCSAFLDQDTFSPVDRTGQSVSFLFFTKESVPAWKPTPFISPAGSRHVPSGRCRYLK